MNNMFNFMVGEKVTFSDGEYLITRVQELDGKKYYCRAKVVDGGIAPVAQSWLESTERGLRTLKGNKPEDLKTRARLEAATVKKEVKRVSKATPTLVEKIKKTLNHDLIKGAALGAGAMWISQLIGFIPAAAIAIGVAYVYLSSMENSNEYNDCKTKRKI